MIEEILWDRPHVILNTDETFLAKVRDDGVGMISGRRKKNCRGNRLRPCDPDHRLQAKITYLAVVADCPELQPLLPQVILPKYTQNARPPQHALRLYSSAGYPFEFWHGTGGVMSARLIQRWATRIRSVVNSFNPQSWICLLMDCCTSHLSLATMSHFRRLGILVLPIPFKMTWLLQLLDVYAFHPLKKDMRLEESRCRVLSVDGVVSWDDRMGCITRSIRKNIVNRDWSSEFSELGGGSEVRPLDSKLIEYLPQGRIVIALPTLHEFAFLIGRLPHTDVTVRLHNMIIRHHLFLKNAPRDAVPPRGAVIDLPESDTARAGAERDSAHHHAADAALRGYLRRSATGPAFLTEFRAARNDFVPFAGVGAD